MTSIEAAPVRIGLIHAVYPAIPPIKAAFETIWPQARTTNLIDDSLAGDLERDGHLTPAMHARIKTLAEVSMASGAQAVLFTCSAFGKAIEEAAMALPIPVLKPNEAMFDMALTVGRRIGMLATFGPAVASMEAEFLTQAVAMGVEATIETLCIPEAMDAARAGDIAAHNRLVAQAAPRLAHCDAIMLAHFSTSSALKSVCDIAAQPVLSAPEAAVRRLKTHFQS